MRNSNFECNLETLSIDQSLDKKFYVVPAYQRTYRWGREETSRLTSDLLQYFAEFLQDPEGADAKFLGSVIVVEVKKDNDPEYYNKLNTTLYLIDGQQRFTTFNFLYASLMCSVLRLQENFAQNANTNEEWYGEYCTKLINLIKCCASKLFVDSSNYYPYFVRQDEDSWVRKDYQTITTWIGKYLHRFYKDAISVDTKNWDYNLTSLDAIDKVRVQEKNEARTFPQDLYTDNIKEALAVLGNYTQLLTRPDKVEELKNITHKMFFDAYRASGTSNFLFEKEEAPAYIVAVDVLTAFVDFLDSKAFIANVTCSDRIALDVFESLNTAGRPLCSIETFIPEVYKELRGVTVKYPSGHDNPSLCPLPNDSLNVWRSKQLLDKIKELIRPFGSDQKLISDLAITFGRVYAGQKVATAVSSQRNVLRKNLDAIIKWSSDSKFHLTEYVYLLYLCTLWSVKVDSLKTTGRTFLSDFLSTREWKEVSKCNPEIERLQQRATFALLALTDLKLTMIHSIFIRFLYELEKAKATKDYEKIADAYNRLLSAIIVTFGYTVFWLSCDKGTDRIEETYLNIFTGKNYSREHPTVGMRCYAITSNNISLGEQPKVAVLENFYMHQLNKRFDNTFSLDLWKSKLMHSRTAKKAALTRALLFIANSGSEIGEDGERISKSRNDFTNLNYLSFDSWSKHYPSDSWDVEHVIPKSNLKGEVEGWRISQEVRSKGVSYLVHQLGNATLLPKTVNRMILDFSWNYKRSIYSALSIKRKKDLDDFIAKVNENTKLKKSQKDAIKKLVKTDSLVDFTKDFAACNEDICNFVVKRTNVLADVIWEVLRTKFLKSLPEGK